MRNKQKMKLVVAAFLVVAAVSASDCGDHGKKKDCKGQCKWLDGTGCVDDTTIAALSKAEKSADKQEKIKMGLLCKGDCAEQKTKDLCTSPSCSERCEWSALQGPPGSCVRKSKKAIMKEEKEIKKKKKNAEKEEEKEEKEKEKVKTDEKKLEKDAAKDAKFRSLRFKAKPKAEPKAKPGESPTLSPCFSFRTLAVMLQFQ